MKHQITIEEIVAIEEQCRKLRSEAIYTAFASLFTGLWRRITSLFGDTPRTENRLGDGALGAGAR